MPFFFQKKILWAILILFFTFDDVLSYWAIKYMHAKEANLLIAPIVEKYPILYFPLIPLTIIVMFIIIKLILKGMQVIFKKWTTDKDFLEIIILGGTVIFWGIANSSANLVFLLGFRIPGIWLKTNLIALPIILCYIFYMVIKILNSKNKLLKD